MEDFESSLNDAVDQLQIKLYENQEKPIPENVLTEPLKREDIAEDALSPSFSFDSELSLSKKELILKRLLNELVSNVGDTDMQKLSVLLDFCYHLKFSDEAESSVWAALFFDLSATCISTLTFPHELGVFSTYLVSRLPWYLEGLSKEPIANGETNLKMGIRPPAAKLFFSIDTFLKNLDSHSLFITPSHFELVHKLLWWISQLIPINDHCNINRKAKIMKEYPVTFWAPHLPNPGPTPTILSDWINICDDILLHPLDWIFSHPKEKLSIEPVMHRFIDEILLYETELYNLVKRKNENHAKQEAAVNGKEFYSLNFISKTYDEPKDSRKSILASKVDFWKDFGSISEISENIVQLLPFELDLFDLKSFQDRIEAYEYDYFRKLIILQIYLVLYLLKEIISSDSLIQYYGKLFKQNSQSHPNKGRIEYGNNALNKNDAAINLITKNLNRITSFYETRDTQFYDLLINLAQNEADTLNQKVVDFANLKNIHWSSEIISEPIVNAHFKKFGWIKLGNKKLDSLWKVQSGLDFAKKFSEDNRKDPTVLYDSIISVHKSKCSENPEDASLITDNAIVKQWQTLRSLRPRYLFDFNKVSEKTTLDGFADETLIGKDIESKRNELAARQTAKSRIHADKVAEAEQYFKDKEQKRKELLEAKIQSQRNTLENAKTNTASDIIEIATGVPDVPKRELESSESDVNQESQTAKKRKLEDEAQEPDELKDEGNIEKEIQPNSNTTYQETPEGVEVQPEVQESQETSSPTE
ncbi:unnamed protein product [Kluyveromyces dobzhanskii CBS 2104]|uniref:WGS project CCBQ000000000 data, contig 00015 n=1 Tax=Kluyveromyces dobzhanskii CBS 2104 TaxID=1427455 RepID=A0A0A8L9W2_9SACH|nr:unnamed protein product [Kluyveromyces dobzhanskii CBS 2104]